MRMLEIHVKAANATEWEAFKKQLGAAWAFQIYFFSVVYFGIAAFVIVCLVRLRKVHVLLPRFYFYGVSTLVLVFCIVQGAYLLDDKHDSSTRLLHALEVSMAVIDLPCLTSAFCLHVYAVLMAAGALPRCLRRANLVVGVVILHLLTFVSFLVVRAHEENLPYMAFHVYQVLWNLLVCGIFFSRVRQLFRLAGVRQLIVDRTMKIYTVRSQILIYRFNLIIGVQLSVFTAVMVLILVLLHLCEMAHHDLTSIAADAHGIKSRVLYAYISLGSFLKTLICMSMVNLAFQPFRRGPGRTSCPALCSPCVELVSCPDSDDLNPGGWGKTQQACMTHVTSTSSLGDFDSSLEKEMEAVLPVWGRWSSQKDKNETSRHKGEIESAMKPTLTISPPTRCRSLDFLDIPTSSDGEGSYWSSFREPSSRETVPVSDGVASTTCANGQVNTCPVDSSRRISGNVDALSLAAEDPSAPHINARNLRKQTTGSLHVIGDDIPDDLRKVSSNVDKPWPNKYLNIPVINVGRERKLAGSFQVIGSDNTDLRKVSSNVDKPGPSIDSDTSVNKVLSEGEEAGYLQVIGRDSGSVDKLAPANYSDLRHVIAKSNRKLAGPSPTEELNDQRKASSDVDTPSCPSSVTAHVTRDNGQTKTTATSSPSESSSSPPSN